MPMFTKKHYELIAKGFKAARTSNEVAAEAGALYIGAQIGIGMAQAYITDILAEDNPLFDAERFAQASGMMG